MAAGVIVCVGFATARGDEGEAAISIGTELSLRSAVLGETRTIQVALPTGYAERHGYTRYPVLYLLDGQKFFQTVTGVVQHLASDASPRVPDMIVVGVTSQERVRDSSPTHSLKGPLGCDEPDYASSGGADKFLRFLTDELVPFVDRTYSTSGYRLIVGYSFTGLPVMHALFTRPQAFNAYLAIDPSWWWDDYLLEKEARRFIAAGAVDRRALFVTTTTNNPPTEFFPKLRYVDTLSSMLQAQPVKGLRFGLQDLRRRDPPLGGPALRLRRARPRLRGLRARASTRSTPIPSTWKSSTARCRSGWAARSSCGRTSSTTSATSS